jgi:hypothetical protein
LLNTPEEWSNLRRRWFGSVSEIADLEFQRRTWLSPPTPSPHWSYVEFCCKYPDQAQLQFALNRGHLKPAEFALLADLGKAISDHEAPKGDCYDHPAILRDAAWLAVVTLAEATRKRLLAIATDPVERSYLIGQERF